MSTLFVANISTHKHIFHFELPEGKKGRLPIEAMTQQPFKDLTSEDIAAIVDRYRPYGMVDWQAARRSKTFVGLCYSIDTPIKIDVFFETKESNDAAVNAVAAKVSEESTVALMGKLETELGKPVSRVEVETVESVNIGDPKRPEVSNGVEVVKPGVQPKHQGGNVVVKK